MNHKSIKSVLSKVHKQFVDSITDSRVKGLVEANSIISGGSIVSMLLGEKINDFDYYFSNKETAVAVAEYFLEQFKKVNNKYADYKVWVNGDRIEFSNGSRDVIGDYDGETDNDLAEYADIIGRDQDKDHEHIDEIRESAGTEKPKYLPTFLTSNAVSLTGRIQLVLRFYGSPEEIHSNYDFIHATSYWVSKTNELVLPQAALEAILAKELRYVGSKYPICSIFRTKKFIQRGWRINAGQYLKMVWQAHELELTNVDVLRDQLVGVDSAYFMNVIQQLQKKKTEAEEAGQEFKVDKTYLFEIINRIF